MTKGNWQRMMEAAIVVWLCTPAAALALDDFFPNGNTADKIYIGMVDRPGDGTTNRVATVCVDSTNASDDEFFPLGTASGLSQDWRIHGDVSASLGLADVIYMIKSNGTNPSGFCGTGGSAGGTWNVLAYNGFYLDLYGEGGSDTEISDAGGSGDTFMFGGAGGDYMVQRSSLGKADGEDGNDTIMGWSSGGGDSLWGRAGNDCLSDSNNSFTTFDCGEHTGDNDTYDSSNTGVNPNCETADPCACFC